jgi:hypothetical protein
MPFRLTTVATCRNPAEAWTARNYLAARGIRAFVQDENISTAIWTWGNAIGWTKLQVETEFDEPARQTLSSRREDRDYLLDQCREASRNFPETAMPPCMDRKPITAAERPERKANEREDSARRGKWAAVFALVLLGSTPGIPSAWERGVAGAPFVLIAGLGLLGYSTRLLWSASIRDAALRRVYRQDFFWGRCMNVLVYLTLAIAIIGFIAIKR